MRRLLRSRSVARRIARHAAPSGNGWNIGSGQRDKKAGSGKFALLARLTTAAGVGIVANMDAVLLYRRKIAFPDGPILEAVICKVPSPVLGSTHSFKYRLFFGVRGMRVIGYDNERGKGDYRHSNSIEERYVFTSPEQLITDFFDDVDKRRSVHANDDDRS